MSSRRLAVAAECDFLVSAISSAAASAAATASLHILVIKAIRFGLIIQRSKVSILNTSTLGTA